MYQILCQDYHWQIIDRDNKTLFEGKGPVSIALAVAKLRGYDIAGVQTTKEAA